MKRKGTVRRRVSVRGGGDVNNSKTLREYECIGRLEVKFGRQIDSALFYSENFISLLALWFKLKF